MASGEGEGGGGRGAAAWRHVPYESQRGAPPAAGVSADPDRDHVAVEPPVSDGADQDDGARRPRGRLGGLRHDQAVQRPQPEAEAGEAGAAGEAGRVGHARDVRRGGGGGEGFHSPEEDRREDGAAELEADLGHEE
eukprot:6582676-Pyramimonas_sp.AAC.1